MKIKFKRLGIALVALMLLSAGVAGAATFDTESTSTATQSDVSGASNAVDLYPDNSSKYLYVETDGATTSNLTLELSPAQSGVNYTAYSNDTPETVNSSAGHYAFNVSHDELEDIPRDSDGGTYNVTVVNDSGTEILNTEVTFSTPDDERAVLAVTDAPRDSASLTNLVSDRIEISTKEVGYLGLASVWGANESDISSWSGYTKVNGTSSSVTVLLDDSETADAYSTAAEDVEDGGWISESTMWINGIPHKVYKNEAPSDADGTTVVYDPDTDQVTVNLAGSTYEDASHVSLRATANKGYGFGEIWSNFGALDAIMSSI